MSIKKLLILSAAGLAAVTSAAAFAGGPDQMEESLFTPAIYADLHGGYSFYNWNQEILGNTGVVWFTPQGLENSMGGAIGGADVGFQIFKNVAVEVGGFYLPRLKGTANDAVDVTNPTACTGSTSADGSCAQGEQWNWVAYAAGRFDVPMPYVQGLNMFAKLGGAWRGMSNQDMTPPGNAGMHSYVTVIFGAGFDYDIMQTGFRVGVQWLHIPGHNAGTNRGGLGEDDASNHSQLASIQPAQDLLTGSVGYKFDF